jgi:hypothetical protein
VRTGDIRGDDVPGVLRLDVHGEEVELRWAVVARSRRFWARGTYGPEVAKSLRSQFDLHSPKMRPGGNDEVIVLDTEGL